ncbi:MAG: efflux RND transporter periplasmic adaptor subunit [Gemmataceae bacterium]|nr:efflux RND transporter periplasmic adaptor subunit [Gemmataceae bacterium]
MRRDTNRWALGTLIAAIVVCFGRWLSGEPALAQESVADVWNKLTPAARLKFALKMGTEEQVFAKATRDDLVLTIVERAAVELADTIGIVCRLKSATKSGHASVIKWVIDDGSQVKKGDKLVELDGSELRERRKVQAIVVEQAKAALEQAKITLDIVRSQADADERLAGIAVRLAELEEQKYQGNDPKQKEILQLMVAKARVEGERAKAQSRSKIVQAEAEQRVRQAVLNQEAEKLQGIDEGLEQTVLVAPRDGLALHHVPEVRAGSGTAIVAQGEPVREGQKLLVVGDLSKQVLKARIHEAYVSRVRPGQSATVRIDAFPNRPLTATVKHVAPVASQADWFSKDVKVYPVSFAMEGAPANLKPGMSAEVRLTTDQKKAVLQVPASAVLGKGRDRFCYVRDGDALVERPVRIGLATDQNVEITEGLREGDQVLRDPSLRRGK